MPEIYQSVVFGMGFWIDNQGLFMSAPSYATGGGCDMDNAIPVSYTHLTLPTNREV